MTSQTSKMILVALVTAIIVGGGVYVWRQPKVEPSETKGQPKTEQANEAQRSLLYQDSQYGVAFYTNEGCKDYFSMSALGPKDDSTALIYYSVFVPQSDSWPENSAWFGYMIYTPDEYEKIDPNEYPGRPEVALTLNSGNLLTRWSPQDLPNDVPEGCGIGSIQPEKL